MTAAQLLRLACALSLLWGCAAQRNSDCDIGEQRLLLLRTYNASKGKGHWRYLDGWKTAWAAPATQWSNASWTCRKPGATLLLPDTCCWHGVSCCVSLTADCQPGAVTGLSLAHQSVTLSGITSVAPLGCSLRTLSLHSSGLQGRIAGQLLNGLSKLEYLDLSSNSLTSTLPSAFPPLLKVINLMGNHLEGTVPPLCREGGHSLLTDLLIGGNQLTGRLDLSQCASLVSLDAQNNRLESATPASSGLQNVRSLHLTSNNLTGRVAQHLAGTRSLTDLQLAMNMLTGPVPEDILLQNPSLMHIYISDNQLTGTLPGALFLELNTLVNLHLANNKLTGPIPAAIGLSGFLRSLQLRDNLLTGPIPETVVSLSLRALASGGIDLSGNPLSCCLLNLSHNEDDSHRFLGYNASSSLLPTGLEFSTQLRIMDASRPHFVGLSCPYLRLSTQPHDDKFPILVDPDYHLYQGCICRRGYKMVNESRPASPGSPGYLLVRCEVLAPASTQNVWASKPWIIALLVVGGILAVVLLARLYQGTARPALQSLAEMHKRSKGPPVDGLVSIVVTDIENFTALMRRFPEQMLGALHLHNDIIRKCRWQNFGFALEEEGDSFSLIFSDPADAVKFCLQAQQALERAHWPAGLRKVASVVASSQQQQGSFSAKGKGHLEGPLHPSSSSAVNTFFSTLWSSSGSNVGRSKTMIKQESGVESSALSLPHMISDLDGSNRGPAPPSPRSRSVRGQGQQDESAPQGLQGRTSGVAGLHQGSQGGYGLAPACEQVDRMLTSPVQSGSLVQLVPCVGSVERDQHLSSSKFSLRNAWARRTGLFHKDGPLALQSRYSKSSADTKYEAFPGLRVRMGVATGMVSPGTPPGSSALMDLAKVVSDAACGGQTLMCSSTFWAVQHMAWELGAVSHEGLDTAKLHVSKPFPWSRRQQSEEAILLDMGTHVRFRRDIMQTSSVSGAPVQPAVPLILTSAYLGNVGMLTGKGVVKGPVARQDVRVAAATELSAMGVLRPDSSVRNARAFTDTSVRASRAPPAPASTPVPRSSPQHSPFFRMSMAVGAQFDRSTAAVQDRDSNTSGSISLAERQQRVHLYQVLPPALAARGPALGSRLRLNQEEWEVLDPPYFDAPGAVSAPLRGPRGDRLTLLERLPQVTLVFCAVDGARQYMSWNRRDARLVHRELVALMSTVLRQIPGSYFVKHQGSELKYMLAFGSPEMALTWCLAVQECQLYVDWPSSAVRQWADEYDSSGSLVFRGPRLKMGVSNGRPTSIRPDCLGRADYHGDCINLAARLMDGATQGGQVVCEQSLAEKVFGTWASAAPDISFRGYDMDTAPGLAAIQEHSRSHANACSSSDFCSGLAPLSSGAALDSVGPSPGSLQGQPCMEDTGSHDNLSTLLYLPKPAPAFLAGSSAAQVTVELASGPAVGIGGGVRRSRSTLSAEGLEVSELSEGTLPKLSPACCEPGPGQQVQALNIGIYRFKGISSQLSLVHVITARLQGRRFAPQPSLKGKGMRVSQGQGVFAATSVPQLTVVTAYRHLEVQRQAFQPMRSSTVSSGGNTIASNSSAAAMAAAALSAARQRAAGRTQAVSRSVHNGSEFAKVQSTLGRQASGLGGTGPAGPPSSLRRARSMSMGCQSAQQPA